MKTNILKIAIVLSLCKTMLFANEWDFLSINGYGTVGAAYQSNDDVTFRNSFFTDEGSNGDVSLQNYSLFSLQVNAQATEKLLLTVQAIASGNNPNGKFLDLEWANLKYDITDNFDIKVGLMRLPIFMHSDILNVAYSYDQVRLADMYGLVSMNKYQGVELNHRADFDDFSLHSTFLYGKTDSTYQAIDSVGNSSPADINAESIYGLALKLIYDDLSLRASYMRANLDIKNDTMTGVFNQLDAMNIPVISETLSHYKVEDKPVTYLNLGAKYDFENASLFGEYITADSESFIVDIVSWYVGAGYNFEDWAPFMMYSKTKSTSNYEQMSSEGMPLQIAGAIAGANQAFTSISEPGTEMNLETVSLGFRYDLNDAAVLKLQYDKQRRAKETLHVFSSAINFVF